MTIRPETATDFYKTGHIRQYPPNTTFVYSNFTCRSDRLAGVLPDFDHKVVFFGLQGVLKSLNDLWQREFFSKPKEVIVARYQRRMDRSLGPGAVKVEHIAALHDLGYLPVLIKALPEGSRVNMRVALWTIQNTLPEFFWLTNYLETQLSAECWKPVHSATIAYEYRRLLNFYAEITGSPMVFVPWQGHDFSARGMSNIYDAASNGAGHLLSFMGTDTISAIDYLEEYYNAYDDFIGGSVPATEHSVACMGILGIDEMSAEYLAAVKLFSESNTKIDPKLIGEYLLIKRFITEEYPAGIVSLVSDTFDFFRTISVIVPKLKNEILARQPDALGFAKVVFRPDSGDPVKIIAGDPEAPIGSPEHKGAVECLWEIFGGTITTTGHKLLDSHVGLIYGDSITLQRASNILAALHKKGFASANVVFGIGSYTYNMCTRDSFGCAIKATFGVVDGEDRVLFKEPKTDSGTKNSARGFIRIEKVGDDFVQYDLQTREEENLGLLEPVYCNGKMLRDDNLSNIRNRLIPT